MSFFAKDYCCISSFRYYNGSCNLSRYGIPPDYNFDVVQESNLKSVKKCGDPVYMGTYWIEKNDNLELITTSFQEAKTLYDKICKELMSSHNK